MKSRFEGTDGWRLLVETLKKQEIVEHDEAFAAFLAEGGELEEFKPNAEIVTQGNSDNEVYFLISGEANVFVNERFVAARSEGSCIGEMAAIDPAAPRSATVRAKTDVVTLKVSEPKFRDALEKHPRAYRAIAQLLGYRLRQRALFHQPPNPEPVLFLGCSVEALAIAREIQSGLKHDHIDVRIWTDGIFGPSSVTIDALLQAVNSADFAAFVISPDDKVISRGDESPAPRDNVIFELGLFMGRLERERVFLVREQSADVKIPTDLLGITPVTYVLKAAGDLTSAVGPVCTELRKAVQGLGVR